MANGILSVTHDLTSMNLVSSQDGISNVKYVEADATKDLPFDDFIFDLFVSPVSLNLIGLGRYGDSVDGGAIPRFISELERVMASNGIAYISVVFGASRIRFNTHLEFKMSDIQALFYNWEICDFLIDVRRPMDLFEGARFTMQHNLVESHLHEKENVIFLKLQKRS